MSDDVIRAGDLVVVVKATECCGNESAIGKTFTVIKVECGAAFCSFCFDFKKSGRYAVMQVDGGDWLGFQVHRLKKIKPLDVEDVQRVGEGVAV